MEKRKEVLKKGNLDEHLNLMVKSQVQFTSTNLIPKRMETRSTSKLKIEQNLKN